MNNWNMGGWNPSAPFNTMLPHYDIIKVNGEAGAKAFKMGPNSTNLLLDENAPIVWLVQTDGGGYLTATPFSITPYQPPTPVDLNSLEERISKLEKQYESYSNGNRATKKQRQSNESADTTAQRTNESN